MSVRTYVCQACGLCCMSNPTGPLPRWCTECRPLRFASTPRPEATINELLAGRLATYIAATQLALCCIKRHDYTQATSVLLAAQQGAAA